MELSLKERIPCITVTATGGARMQEGILSLMQMAKTSILCARLEEEGIPFISILADPSTAGVMASFASLGDLIIAEPGAYVGFAGKRVIEQTIKQPLPANFQTSEFQLEHGFVDIVASRAELRPLLIRTLRMMTGQPALSTADIPTAAIEPPAEKT
jgi:acetyl-CoA carboxylase carboxyl transferase subunit beta